LDTVTSKEVKFAPEDCFYCPYLSGLI